MKSDEFSFQDALFKALYENKEDIVNSFVERFDLKRLLSSHSWLSTKLNELYYKVFINSVHA